MGHANLTNLSHFWNRHLYAKGKLSIHDCAIAAIKKGETLHASEGEYEDEGMISFGLEFVVDHLWDNDIIEPVNLTPEQKSLLRNNRTSGCSDILQMEKHYEILDSITWKYSTGERARYPEIPVLGAITV